MAGPFAQDLVISPHLFVLSPNNKLLVTCGHWDNSFRVFSIEKGKLLARNEHHNGEMFTLKESSLPLSTGSDAFHPCLSADIVTCMALDKVGTGEYLITGSRDTTSVIWKFGLNVRKK